MSERLAQEPHVEILRYENDGRDWFAGVGRDYESNCLYGEEAYHPAEALVLACLRAVGVGEEELL